MLRLATVTPDGRRVVDHDRVRRSRRGSGSRGHETRPETDCARRVESNRLAWIREGRLRDGVVGGTELELHDIADCGYDVVGTVSQGAVCAADPDDVYDSTAGG